MNGNGRFLAILLSGVLIIGCGDSGTDEVITEDTDTPAPSDSTASSGRTVAVVDSSPNIDGIPLDVYGTDFSTVAVSDATATGPGSEGGMTTDTATDPEPAEPEPEAAGELVWSNIISAQSIEGEFKKVRNDFATKLTSLGTYNSSYLEIPVFGSTMALLAHIATDHDGDIGWKEKAPLIRVLATEMVEITSSNQARGRGGYTKTNEAFLKICDLLDGNDPPELPEVTEIEGYYEIADMAYLMKRVEKGAAWFNTSVGSEDNFKENTEAVTREAEIFILMGTVFNFEDYGYGPAENDEEFAGYADAMRNAAIGVSEAAKAGNFEQYDLQKSNIGQACAQCHMVYRNG